MALENVVQEVLSKGKKEADSIVKEGGKEVLRILSKADEEVRKLIEEEKKSAEEKVNRLREQRLGSVELEARKEIMRAKKEILDVVYKKVLERLSATSKEKREAVLGALLALAAKEFGSGWVYCCEKDADYVKSGSKNFKFDGTIDCAGGIAVENSDRTIKIDYTYETILDELWTTNLKQISDILFFD